MASPDAESPNVDYERANTFGFRRNSTFNGNLPYARTLSNFGQEIGRKLSEVGQKFDPDAQFTKAIIEDYVKFSRTGVEGDVPLPTGFARKAMFWKMVLVSGFVAAVMAVVACGFINIIDNVPEMWASCDFDNDSSCGEWYRGEVWWMLVAGGTGCLIGVIRYAAGFPENIHGLFKEVHSYHVEPKWSPFVITLSALSLASGATLGPEAALSNVGGGLASFITDNWVHFEDDNDRKLVVLTGMASALGALFPTPLLAALMIIELGIMPKSYMESTVLMSIGAFITFALFYELQGVTYLEHISVNAAYLSTTWLEDPGYQSWQLMTGFIVGVISAALGLVIFISLGLVKQIFARLRNALAFNSFLKEVVPVTLAGVIIGAVNYALPMTVGNGQMQFAYIVKYGGFQSKLSQNLLICSGFGRVLLFCVSMNSGHIGGFLFPIMTIGLIAGTVFHNSYPYVPYGLCVGTFMVSIPSGIAPMPYTLTLLSTIIFFFGTYQTIPVFVSVITAYTIICGSGLMKMISLKQREKEEKKKLLLEQQEADANLSLSHSDAGNSDLTQRLIEKKEADEYAFSKYMGMAAKK